MNERIQSPDGEPDSEASRAGGDRETPAADVRATAGERTLTVGGERPIRISSGHRIRHHDGKCSRPHGHNYEVSVRLRGDLTDDGWVADKGTVTDVIDEWDHRFLLERGDPLVEAFAESGDDDAVVVLEAPPTAEVMSAVLERKIADRVPDTVSEVAVTVRETHELGAAGSLE